MSTPICIFLYCQNKTYTMVQQQVQQHNKPSYSVHFYSYNMSEFTKYIADPLSDYTIQSEDSDIEVEDSDSDVVPRRRSRAVPLQYSSDSYDLSDSEMFTESHSYTESWSDVDRAPNIPDFIAEPGPKIIPANKQSIKKIVEMFIGNDLFQLMSFIP
ncbi:hypothetical protein ANTPLA_LOCUS10532 [Anthophora plagiata]